MRDDIPIDEIIPLPRDYTDADVLYRFRIDARDHDPYKDWKGVELVVIREPKAWGGVMVWGRCRGVREWKSNWGERFVIARLLKDKGLTL